MKLEDWLDDLCVRFIINLPPEELESVERICFQVEEAQWFYEDFIRPLDPSLPSLSLRAFSLRIFQHCPLFSEWSTDNYSAAFAEFLAYKSRVPVRGAIMLNEEMDKVILVKGWKKGANWSFPRGKINKDEDDLDCAVREVYEETGFDLDAAGLVKNAEGMKHIEVTMREQHMRLYVFRGVPMDTHFEPRTRKEISRIEWCNLIDLPTLTRVRQQDGMGERVANANKFYMVAPFLVPLKKWIAQQRRRENRISGHTYGPTPVLAEEPPTDHSADFTNGLASTQNIPCDLPEVSPPPRPPIDPSNQLKQILNIDKTAGIEPKAHTKLPEVDTAKSSALLALLRKGSRPDADNGPNPKALFDEVSIPSDVPRSPHPRHVRKPQLPSLPPHFSTPPSDATPTPGMRLVSPALEVVPSFAPTAVCQKAPAPYQRTGDPQFSQAQFKPSQGPRVPPASALPPLTNHAKALLDVFKREDPVPKLSSATPPPPKYPPLHTAAPLGRGHPSHMTLPTRASAGPSSLLPALLAQRDKARSQQADYAKTATPNRRANLLGLFTGVLSSGRESGPSESTPKPALSPVELAASAGSEPDRAEPSQKQLLTEILAQRPLQPDTSEPKRVKTSPAGLTTATISAPLNQPQFDTVTKATGRSSLKTGPARSPVAPHRTLFDPKQGAQKRILTRAAETDRSPMVSPRFKKGANSPSPKRTTPRNGEDVRPFQPQILRRPMTDQKKAPAKSAHAALVQATPKIIPMPTSPPSHSSPQQWPLQHQRSHAGSHKQTLLSLFGKPQTPEPPPAGARGGPSVSPPGLGSGMVSPLADRATMPRSARGSLASIVSASCTEETPTGTEKRQTAASDKAFLLGYLGRIASQEA